MTIEITADDIYEWLSDHDGIPLGDWGGDPISDIEWVLDALAALIQETDG